MTTVEKFFVKSSAIVNAFVDDMQKADTKTCAADEVLCVRYVIPETKETAGLWINDPILERTFIIQGDHCYCINYKTHTIVES